MRYYWMRMGLKSDDGVLIRHIRGHRETQGAESNVLTEAGTGVMWLQTGGVKGCLQPREARRHEHFLLQTLWKEPTLLTP